MTTPPIIIQIDGQHFEAHAPEDEIAAYACKGCAFYCDGTDRCSRSHDLHPCTAPDIIWKPIDISALPEPSSPVLYPADETAKPSNPKDIVGVRKAPMSCLPMNVIAEMGVGMFEGAGRYGRHNFRVVGVRASVYFDAAMRHLVAWWEGEDIDPDSGVSHVSKALTTLAVLRDAQMRGMCTDDRPPRSEPFYPRLNDLTAAAADKNADKSPRHYTIADSRDPT